MTRSKQSQNTIDTILKVSLRLFLEKGYEHTSIQDIVNGLGGLTKGAVYHHFGSKEEILMAATDRLAADTYRQLEAIRDDQSMTGAEKMQAVFSTSVLSPQLALWASVAPQASTAKNARLLGMVYATIFEQTAPSYIQPIIEQGIKDQTIKTDYPQELSEVLLVLANLWINPLLNRQSPEELARKTRVYQQIAQALGVTIVDDGITPLLQRRSKHLARSEQAFEKAAAEASETSEV